jgi:hypothetical protein
MPAAGGCYASSPVTPRVPHEPPRSFILQPWDCFFDAFLDGWKFSGFTRLHEDVRSLCVDLKQWCRDDSNYQNLLLNKHSPAFESVIDEWLSEHPNIASKIAAAGSLAQQQHIKKQAWNDFCNGYALGGYTPQGTNPRMGDKYTCIDVANIYKATVQVHHGMEHPITFTPFDGISDGLAAHGVQVWCPCSASLVSVYCTLNPKP